MTIEKAIQHLTRRYEAVKNDPYLQDPVACALYYTWIEAEEDRLKKARAASGGSD